MRRLEKPPLDSCASGELAVTELFIHSKGGHVTCCKETRFNSRGMDQGISLGEGAVSPT